jgi:GNAT superfamily N-acetyltransferase
VELCTVPYDHPDAVKLITELQQVFVDRYGEEDLTPVDPAQFSPPRGCFVVGYLDGVPAACGGWRAQDGPAPDHRPGDAEVKRMYVVDSARGRGLARRVLADLERSAAEAGRSRIVMETGTRQPEAIALYESCGYATIPDFGVHREHPESVCFAKTLA